MIVAVSERVAGEQVPAEPRGTRKHPRHPFHTELTYQALGRVHVGFSQDIGRGGMFIQTAQPVRPGAIITLLLPLPTVELPFWATASVRWKRDPGPASPAPAGMGVEFLVIDPESQRVLHHFLAQAGQPS